MASKSIGRPAGMPSRIATRASPCDSPAVRKRSIGRSFYPKYLRTPRADERLTPCDRDGRCSCSTACAVLDAPPARSRGGSLHLVADRFLVREDDTRAVD